MNDRMNENSEKKCCKIKDLVFVFVVFLNILKFFNSYFCCFHKWILNFSLFFFVGSACDDQALWQPKIFEFYMYMFDNIKSFLLNSQIVLCFTITKEGIVRKRHSVWHCILINKIIYIYIWSHVCQVIFVLRNMKKGQSRDCLSFENVNTLHVTKVTERKGYLFIIIYIYLFNGNNYPIVIKYLILV